MLVVLGSQRYGVHGACPEGRLRRRASLAEVRPSSPHVFPAISFFLGVAPAGESTRQPHRVSAAHIYT